VKAIPGIETLALTTNGFYLERDVAAYYEAGIRSLNVSVDSLKPEVFAKITGKDVFHRVMAGVEAALKLPFKLKLNAVLLKDLNHTEFADFVAFVKDRPISVRFIELMQTGDNQEYFKAHHLSPAGFQADLVKAGWIREGNDKIPTAGPAIEYSHPNYLGRVGFIAPYSKDFCVSCNRLRLSARGELYLCLFTDLHYALRPLLQADSQKAALQAKIRELLHLKKASHDLHQGNTGKTSDLAKIGG
jgi:cyclic pyranopterin phosphate synthase